MGGHPPMPVPSLRRLPSSSCSFPALRCRHLGRHCVSSLSLLDLVTALSCVFSVLSAAFNPASRTRAVPTTRLLWRGPASLVVPQEGRGHFLLSCLVGRIWSRISHPCRSSIDHDTSSVLAMFSKLMYPLSAHLAPLTPSRHALHQLSVLSVLAAVPLINFTTPLALSWGDIRVKHSRDHVPPSWETLGPPPVGTSILHDRSGVVPCRWSCLRRVTFLIICTRTFAFVACHSALHTPIVVASESKSYHMLVAQLREAPQRMTIKDASMRRLAWQCQYMRRLGKVCVPVHRWKVRTTIM
ncbi:hypothetical protein EDB86DRAFT_3108852 [Lactarius hatsudake]|nr:hypothetical protein EDB86DRAFT_3108852 [Lactarius hatsudake]